MRLPLFILSFLTPFLFFSQDMLYTRKNKRIPIKVIDVNPYVIIFKKTQSPDSTRKIAYIEDVVLLEYENGNYSTFYNSTSARINLSSENKIQLYSPDRIYTKEGKRIEAWIVKHTAFKVFYRDQADTTGKIFSIPVSELRITVRLNGSFKIYGGKNPKLPKPNLKDSLFHRYSVGVNFCDMLFGNFASLYSEARFLNGYMGFKLPIVVGGRGKSQTILGVQGKPLLYYNDYCMSRIYSVQADLLFYPKGQRTRKTFYVGPGVHYGEISYESWAYDYTIKKETFLTYSGYRIAYHLNIGFNYNIDEHFKFNLQWSPGYGTEKTRYTAYGIINLYTIGLQFNFKNFYNINGRK